MASPIVNRSKVDYVLAFESRRPTKNPRTFPYCQRREAWSTLAAVKKGWRWSHVLRFYQLVATRAVETADIRFRELCWCSSSAFWTVSSLALPFSIGSFWSIGFFGKNNITKRRSFKKTKKRADLIMILVFQKCVRTSCDVPTWDPHSSNRVMADPHFISYMNELQIHIVLPGFASLVQPPDRVIAYGE